MTLLKYVIYFIDLFLNTVSTIKNNIIIFIVTYLIK